jgi:hypothetical protein
VAVTAALDRAQLLGGDPGGGDLTVVVAGLHAGQQPRPRSVGEVLGAAALDAANAVERVVTAAPMTERLLLDAAGYVVDGGQSQPHHMKRSQYPHGVR